MKICLVGAGAIGGLLGARLARAGEDVTLIARGAHLAAIREHGLRLRSGGEEDRVEVKATDDAAAVGPQDYVVVTLKAHSVPAMVEPMQALLGRDTAIVSAVNGIPWWYFYKLDGPWRDTRVEAVDPGGRQWSLLGPRRAIGCVVYPACEIVEPGVIEHVYGDRFSLGEPDGVRSERCAALSRAFIAAGFKAPVRGNIRNEIWVKLWGNLSFNPVSVLTHATLDVIAGDAGTHAIVRSMMVEAQSVAEALGAKFPLTVDARIAGAAEVGAHKTSMLQDLERGRAMEIDAMVGAVIELGRLVAVPTPTIDMMFALLVQRARAAGTYAG